MEYMCHVQCAYRTSSGHCGSTGGYATCQYRKMDEPPTIKSAEPIKPMTNADKHFRHATDEELALFLKRFSDCAFCPAFSTKCKSINFDNCEYAWIDWLKQEVESDA